MFCSFDEGLCDNWSPLPRADDKWQVVAGPDPSQIGFEQFGRFLYLNTTRLSIGMARVASAPYVWSAQVDGGAACVDFWYYGERTDAARLLVTRVGDDSPVPQIIKSLQAGTDGEWMKEMMEVERGTREDSFRVSRILFLHQLLF